MSEIRYNIKDLLPQSLIDAEQRGIEYFMDESCEWKLEMEGASTIVETVVQCPVWVFANNGFGDYLFLKKNGRTNRFDQEVYEFCHEGPEIRRVPEGLETLLGLKDRPPSRDNYPTAVYETGEAVRLGDFVRVKVWAEFWKGWQDGVVKYVPGISKKNLQYESGGLKWVAITFRNGEICPLVNPQNGKLKKVQFVRRGDGGPQPQVP